MFLSKASDDIIWEAVLELPDHNSVPASHQDSPAPKYVEFSYKATPVKASGQLNSTEKRDLVEDGLLREIERCTFIETQGFIDRFFEGPWTSQQESMCRDLLDDHDEQRWVTFPSNVNEANVRAWLFDLQRKHLATSIYMGRQVRLRAPQNYAR